MYKKKIFTTILPIAIAMLLIGGLGLKKFAFSPKKETQETEIQETTKESVTLKSEKNENSHEKREEESVEEEFTSLNNQSQVTYKKTSTENTGGSETATEVDDNTETNLEETTQENEEEQNEENNEEDEVPSENPEEIPDEEEDEDNDEEKIVDHIHIRDAANGEGSIVSSPDITAGTETTYYAAAYDENNTYIQDVSVIWKAEGVLNNFLSTNQGNSTTITPTLTGNDGSLSATYTTQTTSVKIALSTPKQKKVVNNISNFLQKTTSSSQLCTLHISTSAIATKTFTDTIGTATVNPAELASIIIRTGSDNEGSIVESLSFTAGDEVTYYAAGYDKYDNYREDVSVTWSGLGILNGSISGSTGNSTIVRPTSAGTNGTLAITHSEGLSYTVSSITVSTAELYAIKIRTAANNSGTEASSPALTTLASTTYYAAGYDEYNNYRGEETLTTWAGSGVINSEMITDNEDGSVTITPTQGGSAGITATSGAVVDSIGTATVALNTPNFDTMTESLENFAEDERAAVEATYGLSDGSDLYEEPTEKQLMQIYEITEALRQYVQNDQAITWEDELKNTINTLNLEIYNFTDTDSGNNFFMVREKTAARNGWGWFVINKNPSNGTLIGTPHVIHDFKTTIVGAKITSNLDNIGQIASGADRGSSNTLGNEEILNNWTSSANYTVADPSHYHSTMFHYVHTSLIKDASILVQPHGYTLAGDKETCLGAPYQVVISAGILTYNSNHTAIKTAATNAGYSPVVFAAEDDGDDGANIALSCFVTGTQTVQGYLARALGKTYVQYETDINLRNTNTARTINASIIINALNP